MRCVVSWSQTMGVTGLRSLRVNWSYLILIILTSRGWMVRTLLLLLWEEGEYLAQVFEVPAEDHLHHLAPEILHFSKLLLTTIIKQLSYINKVLLNYPILKPLIILLLLLAFYPVLCIFIFLLLYLLVICFLKLIYVWNVLIHCLGTLLISILYIYLG
jgi:hypothetical protein